MLNKMNKFLYIFVFIFWSMAIVSYGQESETKNEKVKKSDNEWKELLTPMQFHVLRESGTESPFTGEFENTFNPGEYLCVGL